MKIVIGDFNARVGRERMYFRTENCEWECTNYIRTMDHKYLVLDGHSLLCRELNKRLINWMRVYTELLMITGFATLKNLLVKSTMFPHRKIHKYTSTSPDGKTRKNRLITSS
jgi:hypothetical protein